MHRSPLSVRIRRAAVPMAVGGLSLGFGLGLATPASASAFARNGLVVPTGAIQHVIVIDLENESFSATFGAGSPATYLNQTLLPKGELLEGYYGVGHVSLDNYIAQVSGQAPNLATSSDCTGATGGAYDDVTPGTLDPDQARYPGQVDGQGCVFPSSVQTIGNQLQQAYPWAAALGANTWRDYSEDMGNDPTRDGGQADPLGEIGRAHV